MIDDKQTKIIDGKEIEIQDKHTKFIFEYQVVDHCNLNCAGCTHSSPLVTKPIFKKPSKFECDVKQLSKFFEHADIELLGGEPFLHPQLGEFCRIAAKYFDKLEIVTNGTLIQSLPQELIDTINDLHIIIQISDYGLIPNIKSIAEGIFREVVCHEKFGMIQQPWDFNANYNLDTILYKDCHNGDGKTIMDIRDGYLYKCGHQCYSDYLLKYFNIDLPDYDRDKDRLNLYTMTEWEFLHFVNNPVQFCRYCAYSAGDGKIMPWAQSKRQKSEFIKD